MKESKAQLENIISKHTLEMLAERIPTPVLAYDTNLKDQILHETA